jgi:hypothetical protein
VRTSLRAQHPPNSLFALLLTTSVLAASGCKVDAEAFHSRIFSCDRSAASSLCGTDRTGAQMTCFAARQLGATDFCTESCTYVPMTLAEPTTLAEDGPSVCVQGNARLKTCNPAEGDDACGQRELGCLRTDVNVDEGVCVTMKPCSKDDDCDDPVRSTCASTFFKRLFSKNTKIRTDHLYCIQEGCEDNASACSPSEACLKKVVPAAANPPDICVPKCDSKLQCPPNFFCLKDPKISGPANPGVCIPGLLGFKCLSDNDCLMGRCLPDGGDKLIPGSPGLNLCTVDCESDADCEAYDSPQGLFFCNADHHCATPQAYLGASCNTQADCTRDPDTTVCVHLDPKDSQGTCIHPCGAEGACPALGGVPHTCLGRVAGDPKNPGVCFPGRFGMPCADDASCTPGLTCRAVAPGAPTKICTTLCQNQPDCDGNRWVSGQGFCGGAVCLPYGSLPPGSPCGADAWCESASCTPPTAPNTPGTCGEKQ